jgi:outer membrane immunogenic protein
MFRRKGKTMKRILLATVALAALGLASALAADLPQRPEYKAPMMVPAPVATWTGCYIGGNIGGAFGNASASTLGGEVSGDNSGFAGGGQIGCDYQFSGGFVIGARELLDYTSNSTSGTFPVGAFGGLPAVANFNNQWFDTLTARLGYAVVPNVLFYFQGGAAWAHTSTNVGVTFAGVQYGGQTSNTTTGWTIGGGVEWMFAPHWSTFLEGNYMDFGSKSGTVVTPAGFCAGAGCPITAKATETTVLVGVNYHFF